MKKRIIKKKVDQTCSVVITMAWMENPEPDFTPLKKVLSTPTKPVRKEIL